MPHLLAFVIRYLRNRDQVTSHGHESLHESENVPFLTQEQIYLKSQDLEDGAYRVPCSDELGIDVAKSPVITCTPVSVPDISFDPVDHIPTPVPAWRFTDILPSLRIFGSGRTRAVVHKENILDRRSYRLSRTTPLRKALRLLAYSLMLL